jgi:hypothetical protein
MKNLEKSKEMEETEVMEEMEEMEETEMNLKKTLNTTLEKLEEMAMFQSSELVQLIDNYDKIIVCFKSKDEPVTFTSKEEFIDFLRSKKLLPDCDSSDEIEII